MLFTTVSLDWVEPLFNSLYIPHLSYYNIHTIYEKVKPFLHLFLMLLVSSSTGLYFLLCFSLYIPYLIPFNIQRINAKVKCFLQLIAIFFSITDIHLVGTRVEISLYVILSVPAECLIQEFVVYRTDRTY